MNSREIMGFLLKKVRLEKNIKQIVLARGICSVSYLSKIENGQAVASKDILEHLQKRLGIEMESISEKKETDFMNRLFDVYKNALTVRNTEELQSYTNEITKQYEFQTLQNYFTYSLLMFRFSLMLNSHMELIETEISYLETNESKYEMKEQYLFYINKSLYKYLTSSYEESLLYIEQAKELLTRIVVEPWERADFNYIICLCYSKLYNFSQSIEYGQQSLDYFRENLFFNRAIDCHIIMGNAQKNLSNYCDSEKHYNLAFELTNLLQEKECQAMIHHNLGLLYSSQGLLNRSIESSEKSLSLKDQSCLNSYFLTKYTLIKTYYISNHQAKAAKLCRSGLRLIQQNGQNAFYKKYFWHFSIYLSMLTNMDDIEGLLKNALDYFQSTRDNWNTGKYSLALAEYYNEIKQHKNANYYYRIYINVQSKQILKNSWEVL